MLHAIAVHAAAIESFEKQVTEYDQELVRLRKQQENRRALLSRMKAVHERALKAKKTAYDRDRMMAYLPPRSTDPVEPEDRWIHDENGHVYTVICIANPHDTPKFPATVVYRDADGNVYARPLSDWHRSFTPRH